MRVFHTVPLAFLFLSGCLNATYSGANTSPDLSISDDPNDDSPPIGNPDPPPPPPDLAGAVKIDAFMESGTATMTMSEDATALRLNESKDITITVNGNGVTGTATPALLNAPTGFTATFNPPTVTLAGSPVMLTMTVHAASDMDPATSVAAMVQLTAGSQMSTATYGITVMPELMVYIAQGVVTTTMNPMAFGAMTIPVKLIGTGTQITFVNNDTIEHRIHATGTDGLNHEPNNMAASGGTYTQTLTATNTALHFSCHIHSNMQGVLNIE